MSGSENQNSGSKSGDRRRVDPVGMFFGPTPPGPFALLGLEAAQLEPTQVLEAMHARLEQLTRHPQSATPAADEVRLALHAAAAQLCDPAVRRLLLGMWASDKHTPSQQPSTPRPSPSASQLLELERELHAAIGLSGGWNAAAMQRMAMACQAHDANLDDVLRMLHVGVSTPPPVSSVSRKHSRPRRHRVVASPVAAQIQDISFRWDLMLLVAFGVLTVISILAVVIMLTPSKPKPPTPSASSNPPLQTPDERREAKSLPQRTEDFAGDLESGDPRAITLEITGATQDLPTDAKAAAARFALAQSAFGKSWTLMKQDEIASIVSAIVDYVFAASRQDSDVVPELTRALREPKWNEHGGVRSLAAADGVAARLLSERDLPRAFLDELRSTAEIAGSLRPIDPALSFRSAVERSLTDISAAIASSEPQSVQAWREFIEVRDAVLGDKQPAKDQVTISALDLVLRGKPGNSRELAASVQILAAALSWHPGDEMRNAIFGWIEDMAVPSELVSQITKAMVASSAPGVDSTMVLPVSAGPDLRTTLRERLAQVWQASAPVSTEVIASWQAKSADSLARKAEGTLQQLLLAHRFSQLSRVADLLLQAKPDEAESVMKEFEAAQSASGNNKRTLVPIPAANPHSPALDFAQAGISVQGRLEALKKIQTMGDDTDSLLARTLVIESSRGSPASVRDLARSELRRRLQSPSILIATMEFLRLMPETPENADWVSDLVGKPGAWKNRPKWKSQAELALVSRACEQFLVSTEEGEVDAAAAELSRSWWTRAGESDGSTPPPPGEAADRLETSLASVARSAGASEAGLSPIEIRRRLAARLSIAPSSLEQAVARQAACVEWISLATLHDRSRNAAAVRAILTEWNAARQRASTSIQQLLEGERAMLKLQMLRLTSGGKS